MWRMTITWSLLIAITWYLLTTEAGGDETNLDLVKDFTALVIIVEVDSIIKPLLSIDFDELDIYRTETLEKRFITYNRFYKKN